ncbi:MAG: sugar ABC transporter ATP-binding protein [Thermoprotei archaeon]|nr:MAG: sugar ABC transporter ATP-binding protein [Thermoprotei archaeon]
MVRESEYLVFTKNLVKRFGDVVALKGVNFRVGYNEVVGLVGDNGAGKSTLAKILAGIYVPDEGEIYVKGQRFRRLTPQKARELGIELVHQERTLAEDHPIWRNIFMGREITGPLGFLRIKEMKAAAEKLLNEIGLKAIPPDTPVKFLSGGYKQGVQIARAVQFEADLVILDEPTIQLSISEVHRVLEYVHGLKKRGKSCVFITHNIYHVYPVADRFVIIDRGKIVAEFRKVDVTPEDLTHILVSIARTGTIPEKYEKINLLNVAGSN